MSTHSQPASPFRPGALVIATLANPREKFWARFFISRRSASACAALTFLRSTISSPDPRRRAVYFRSDVFPMHRVERLELDLPEGNIPSLAQRFAQKTGQVPAPLLVSEFLPPGMADDADDGAGSSATNAIEDSSGPAAGDKAR